MTSFNILFRIPMNLMQNSNLFFSPKSCITCCFFILLFWFIMFFCLFCFVFQTSTNNNWKGNMDRLQWSLLMWSFDCNLISVVVSVRADWENKFGRTIQICVWCLWKKKKENNGGTSRAAPCYCVWIITNGGNVCCFVLYLVHCHS